MLDLTALSAHKESVEKAEQALLEALLLQVPCVFAGCAAEEERTRFFDVLEGVSPRVWGAVCYELARRGLSHGHGYRRTKLPMPFEFAAFAGGFGHGGIAFKINRECFQCKTPRLFFRSDSLPFLFENTDEYIKETKSRIWNASTQIELISMDVHISKQACCSRIEFRLTEKGPWGALRLQDGFVPCSLIGAPIIQLPYLGEFDCCLGEVTPDGDVVLHRDSFCMK